MRNKAQGSLEYLLLIGAAILIGAIVASIVVNLASKNKGRIDNLSEKHDDLLNQGESLIE